MSNSRTDVVVTADAAKALRVSTRQVARMVADGRLEAYFKAPGVRGAYLFKRSDVEALAQEDSE